MCTLTLDLTVALRQKGDHLRSMSRATFKKAIFKIPYLTRGAWSILTMMREQRDGRLFSVWKLFAI